MNKLGQFIANGMLLTLISLFIRTVSVAFNVYVSNAIGAEALGLFTLVSTVYGFGLTLATSGINLATTRLISECIGKSNIAVISIRKNKEIKAIIKKCVKYALLFSVSVSVLFYFFADFIGINILGDVDTVSSIRLLSISFVPISVSSVFNGYFVAVRRVYKNAVIQVLEQFIKIWVIITLISSSFCDNIERSCVALVIGIVLSESFSFIINLILYTSEKDDGTILPTHFSEQRKTTKKLIGIALPVALSAYIRSGLISIEHILIPISLQKNGANKSTALAEYGTIQSMVFPLVLYPAAILYAFSSLLISEVSESNAANDKKRINRIISKVIRTSLLYSIGVAGIMLCFSNELGEVIYPGYDTGRYIKMIAPLIPIMYIDSSVDAILKGLGKQVYSMVVNILDVSLSIILVAVLLPKYGIAGYILTIYFTELVNTSLSLTKLISISSVRPSVIACVIKPLIAVLGATLAVNFISLCDIIVISSDILRLVVYILSTVILYFVILFLIGAIRKNHITKIKEIIKDILHSTERKNKNGI